MSETSSVDRGVLTRRDFLKLLAAGSLGIAFSPFISWGKYMPNPDNAILTRSKIVLPDGTFANVKHFPVNHQEVVTYPTTGDTVLDQEAFRKWNLIRLPSDLGGNANDVSAFRVYSAICLHLWCMWKYKPVTEAGGNDKGQCPCHGSMYDPSTGEAIQGPASLQAPPSNILPRLDLESDVDGDLWIKPPIWNTYQNGIVGYGRFVR